MRAAHALLEKIGRQAVDDLYRTSFAVSVSVEQYNVFIQSDAIAVIGPPPTMNTSWFRGADCVLAAATHLLRVAQK